MRYHYLLALLTACAVLAASAAASAQDNVTATATFSRTDVRIVEASSTTLEVRIAPPQNEDFPALGSGGEVVLEVTPAAAVTTGEACPTGGDDADVALLIWSDTELLVRNAETGAITIDRDLRDYNGQPAELRLTACENRSDYRDSTITLAFVAASLDTQRGNVVAGPPARIQVINDDPVPVVDFATGALEIDEGMSRTVAVVAEGELGGAVMQVAVDVAGDARISLQQSDQPLNANPDGSLAVALSASGTAVVTVRADGDETLAAGETKQATVRIANANGAKIGGIDTLTVTVTGSTDVPALPLVGLLLQALLLAGAGVRLYRRRQG